jgi:hypothetical protein
MSRSVRVARAVALVTAFLATGCGAIRTSAIKSVADTLSEGGTTFSSHNDPELIEGAMPFALTLYESLLDSIPRHEPLLTATCAAYTQYAHGFVQVHAEETQFDNYERSRHYTDRALNLGLRGRDFCWRGLEVRFRNAAPKLKRDPVVAVAAAKRAHVPLLYWSAASLGAAISLGGIDHPELLIDWPVVRALGERALALDDTWGNGAVHELLMTVESQGEALGSSEERARQHFARAVEIQKGLSPSPYLGLALGLARSRQDRREFEELLRRALAIDPAQDPDNRLVTLIMQKRARHFLDHADDLFLED